MRNFLALLCIISLSSVLCEDPDVGKNMVEIVKARGYPIEEHYVQTKDGYILGVYRIPYGRAGPTNGTRTPPVMLQHGLEDSSWTWVSNFADQSLAYILADAGYDVWLGNNRGTTWSKMHAWLPIDSKEYWDFTWDEMAKYDLPAMVAYVRNQTGFGQVSYVGHSEGTIQAFAGFSISAELSSQVNFFGALAPVAYVANLKSLLLDLIIDLDVDKIFQFFGVKQFLPNPSILQELAPELCDLVDWACDDFLFLIVGPGHSLNESRIEVYVSQTPAGTSVKNLAHWAQNYRDKKYQMYDYGCGLFSCKNEDKYGQRTPPQYSLANMTVPTALYYSDDDDLADPVDVDRLIAELPSSSVIHKLHMKDYNHLDFTWAVDANKRVYADLVDQINQIWNKTAL